MLEYVRRLLLAQTRLAAQFDTAPQPEIREIALRAERETGDAQEQNTQSREKRPGLMQTGAEMDGTETWSAEQALREMARQTMRLESMQLQKSAQAQLALRRVRRSGRCRRFRVFLSATPEDMDRSLKTADAFYIWRRRGRRC